MNWFITAVLISFAAAVVIGFAVAIFLTLNGYYIAGALVALMVVRALAPERC